MSHDLYSNITHSTRDEDATVPPMNVLIVLLIVQFFFQCPEHACFPVAEQR